MAAEHGIAALLAATADCTLRDLDGANSGDAAVLVSSDGMALRLAASAATLIRLVRSGASGPALAEQFGVAPELLETRAGELATRIRATLAAIATRKPSGFVAQRTIVSGARVTRLATGLAVLFAPTIAIPALIVALGALAAAYRDISTAVLPSSALWGGYLIALVLMFGHELGHAAACRRFGAPVGAIGCALYLIYPAWFCDVTHTWALPRRQRLVVDLGGIYFQLLTTALLAAVWYATHAPVVASAIRISLATVILNVSPVGRLDGYWILSDLLGIVDLRRQQRVVARALFGRLRGRSGPALPWPWWITVAIAGYAVATLWFLATILTTFLPFVAREIARLPERIGDVAGAHALGDAMAALGRVASSLVLAWIAVAIVRELARSWLRPALRGVRA